MNFSPSLSRTSRRTTTALALAVAVVLTIGAATLSSAPASATSSAKAPTVLFASVSSSITLKTKSGAVVKSLKAGTYTVQVTDSATSHNFHLSGPGFNKKTSVSGTVTNQKWTLKATKGTYKYVCDPHASVMKGSFTVA